MKTSKGFKVMVFVFCFLGVVSTAWSGETPKPKGGIPAGDMPIPLPYPEYKIGRIEGNKVTLLTAVQVRDPGVIKVGDRVKIQDGKLMKAGTTPTKPGDSKALTPIQIPYVPEGGKVPPGPPAEFEGKAVPQRPGDTKAFTPIQISNVPEGGKTPPGPGQKGLMSYPEYSISRIEGNKVTLLTVVQVRDPGVIKVGDRVKIQDGKMIKGEATPEPIHRPPPPSPKGQQTVNQQLIDARIKRMHDFDKNWAAQFEQAMRNAKQKRAQLQLKHAVVKKPIAAATPVQRIDPKLIEAQAKEIVAKERQSIGIQAAHPAPYINNISGLMIENLMWKNNEVEEGSYVIISGINFRDCSGNCGVALEYQEVPEAGRDFQKGATHRIDLLPYNGDWNKCWYNNFIIAQVPFFPVDIASKAKGNVVVWKGGTKGFNTTRPVTIDQSVPWIESISTEPQYADGVNRDYPSAGGKITVYGKGFGNSASNSASDIYLELTEPIAGTWLPRLNLTPTYWSDGKITATIPGIGGNFSFIPARLYVLNAQQNRLVGPYLTKFVPKMVFTLTGGGGYFKLDKQDKRDTVDVKDEIVLVTHDPGCAAVVGDGNSGNDTFFTPPPPYYSLPANCKVVKATIGMIDPNNTGVIMEKVTNEVMEWIEACEDPISFFEKLGKTLVIAIAASFDPDVGKYEIHIEQPGPDGNFIRVHWHNTCWGWSEYDGVPLKYVASFLIWGPDQKCPGIPVTNW